MQHLHTALLFVGALSTVLGQQNPVVDLGYAQYQGFVNATSHIQSFLGIRYAATPQRWQAPQRPTTKRGVVTNATSYGSICAQAASSLPGQTLTGDLGSEDCLFLNVHRPLNASSPLLPVVVWIHGGGYGQGNNRADPAYLYSLTNENFVFVAIQYRLGAFGFLSSNDVFREGALNVGLLDQERALEWVSEHIYAFGGDPDQVTIWGESAGAGSVMHQLLAHGGQPRTGSFRRAMAASPYLPTQHAYNDAIPSRFYNRLADAVGCSLTSEESTFSCLSSVDSTLLKNANTNVSTTAAYGQWAFVPVTDGTFVQKRPSEQLVATQVPSNVSVLIGSNANEGYLFVPSNITTEADFDSYVQQLLPGFTRTAFAKIAEYYPAPNASNGLYTSQAERASVLYGDTTFNCPAIWLASAFTNSYRYLYAIAPAWHGFDLQHYLPSQFLSGVMPDPSQLSFDRDFSGMFVTFLQTGTPSISGNASFEFPAWGSETTFTTQQVTFNEGTTTAGSIIPLVSTANGQLLSGSADRCDFWLAYASLVPE